MPVDNSSIFVVVPAWNEDTVIKQVINQLVVHGYTIVLVDDGSDNNLYSLIQNEPVHFLRHRINLGQGAALQTGIRFACSKKAKFIATFDADGQHDPNDIQKMVIRLLDGNYDIVLGSRFLKGATHNMPFMRKALLQAARFLHLLLTGLLLTDAHNGLRVMKSKAAALIQLKENRMAHATEFLVQLKRHKLKFAEAPVNIQYTDYSLKKGQSAKNGFRILLDILQNKFIR